MRPASNAGALGMQPLTWSWHDAACAFRSTERRPSRIGRSESIWVFEHDQHQRLDLVLSEGVEIVSFFWGDVEPYVPRVTASNAKAMWTIGGSREASRAVKLGIDVIVAQGWEAGGHVWGLR